MSKTEVISSRQFIEYTKEGYPTTFTITVTEPYKRWEFDMENSKHERNIGFGFLLPKIIKTEIDFTEYVTVKKILYEAFCKILSEKATGTNLFLI